MHYAAYGLAGLLAVTIIFLGTQYVVTPWATTSSFGLPRPADDAVTAPWLRLKGVRDIVSGLTVFALMVWGGPKIGGTHPHRRSHYSSWRHVGDFGGERLDEERIRHPWAHGVGHAARRRPAGVGRGMTIG